MLLETITAQDVQIGLHAKNWEDAIRQAARAPACIRRDPAKLY